METLEERLERLSEELAVLAYMVAGSSEEEEIDRLSLDWQYKACEWQEACEEYQRLVGIVR